MLATIRDDTRNMLNMQHLTLFGKDVNIQTSLMVVLENIKRPAHLVEAKRWWFSNEVKSTRTRQPDKMAGALRCTTHMPVYMKSTGPLGTKRQMSNRNISPSHETARLDIKNAIPLWKASGQRTLKAEAHELSFQHTLSKARLGVYDLCDTDFHLTFPMRFKWAHYCASYSAVA